MAEQDIEYILQEPEYRQLQEFKTQVINLRERLKKSQLESDLKSQTILKLEKELAIKNEEVSFFQTLIDQIGRTNSLTRQQLIEITSTINQSVWEVVQQADVEAKKAMQRQLMTEKQKFFSRFEKYVVRAEEISDRLQSQQEQISKLNHSIIRNNQLAIGKTYSDLLREIQKDLPIKLQSVEALKKIIAESVRDREDKTKLQSQLKSSEQLLPKERLQWQLKLKQKQQEVQKYKLNVQKLSPLVSTYYQKIKQLHGKVPPGQGAAQIRYLVDKFIVEIEERGRSTGVSPKELFNRMNEQLTGLTTYIFKTIEGKMVRD